MRILIVEDDKVLADALTRYLRQAGYVADAASSGIEADAILATEEFDLVVLDIGLPGMDGLEVLRRVRRRSKYLPVLVVTARDALEDRVHGLDLGADDYLVKPFVFSELVARLRSIVRRPRQRVEPLRHRNLELDLLSRQARVDGRLLNLSPTEFSLLRCLVESRGEAVTRAMLLEAVWGYRFDPGTNVVDVHVSRLRKKLELARSDLSLVSQRGVGYVVE